MQPKKVTEVEKQRHLAACGLQGDMVKEEANGPARSGIRMQTRRLSELQVAQKTMKNTSFHIKKQKLGFWVPKAKVLDGLGGPR